jgi:hypothetical protein
VQVIQSNTGRIFKFGTLIIFVSGNPQDPVPHISNPMAFRLAQVHAEVYGSVTAPSMRSELT